MSGWADGLRIAPSLLGADPARLGEEVRAITAAGADWLHIDVMDGHFVRNISYGPATIAALRPLTAIHFDVHMMVDPAEPLIDACAEAGANGLTIHAEATAHLDGALTTIRNHGCRAGVALNPGTPPSVLTYVLDKVDMVTVMSVNPGFGGQGFIESAVDKIAELKAMIGGRAVRIQSDGGVSQRTAPRVLAAGTDVLVAGSAVFGAPDYGAAIKALRNAG